MSRSYKDYLRAKGKYPPLTKAKRESLRTEKTTGSVEIVWSPEDGDYVRHVHEGEPGKVVPFRKRVVA